MDCLKKALILKYYRKYFENISDTEINNFNHYISKNNISRSHFNTKNINDLLCHISNYLNGGDDSEIKVFTDFYDQVLRG
ncbi:hypothetical protein QLL95_gp0349 [Cotonvirus japonicus]|uniref:Uncharacterized protein n=1 Tax=Cotonvirus japonicus TaxID=2811091 RepID=A0ABM7NUB0_9VIRU|nr:hypothetical protein QLL95_gp0349 [Cotonvirus japonicus]BCS83774.1 hypothetical protein [Cotonvirus japonicus]